MDVGELMDTVCPKTGSPCRHCSTEVTRMIERTGDIVSGIKRTVTEIPKGEFCNNDGKRFVQDLEACPVPAALAAPQVPADEDLLSWMRRRS